MKRLAVLFAAVAATLSAAPVLAQTPEWRTVSPENLLVIDTSKGRVLVELEPRVAPNHVERVRGLANQGFYDGLKFHRVISGFMAQTGDPQGTGQGGSTLPDIAAELDFRRGRDSGFTAVENSGPGLRGIMGLMPIVTQPDAQMFVTSDFRTSGQALFCPGVAGMARSQALNSANSQFFLMMGENDSLNGGYTPFGRVVGGLDVVTALKAGPASGDGAVTDNPDTMTTVRTASVMPEGQRPSIRVATPGSAPFLAAVEQTRAARGARFTICDVQPVVEATGG